MTNGGTAFDIAWTAPDDGQGDAQGGAPDVAPEEGGVTEKMQVQKKARGREVVRIRVSLTDFQTQDLLDFGSVPLMQPGEEPVVARGELELVNETRVDDVTVHLDRFSAKYGFSVGQDGENEWVVPAQGTFVLPVQWAPTKPGGVRQSLTLSFLNEQRRRVHVGAFLCGVARGIENSIKTRKQKIMRPSSLVRNNENAPARDNRTTTTRPLPLRERPLNKPVTTTLQSKPQPRQRVRSTVRVNSLPSAEPKLLSSSRRGPPRSLSLRHDNLATAVTEKAVRKDLKMRKVLFDARWMEKQEKGFAAWLNYVVDPETEDPAHFDASAHDAALDEAMEDKMNPLAVLARKQRTAAIQRHAYTIYHSREMENVAYEVEREISSGGISIRQDRDMFKDLGLRKVVLDLLHKYNMPWLRLGLETVLGVAVGRHPRSISRIATTYVLGDPELEETYRESKKGLFDENPEYQTELRKRSLCRFLMLVIFLDRAKQASVIDHPSCLFHAKSSIKSSQQMIISYAKEFLAGEGNVLRHLQHSCSYEVNHKQTSLDEFDFKVTNLATDLRDGVRLARAVELLTGNKERTLTKVLRTPAVSRLQKLHNTGVAIKELESRGVDLSMTGAPSSMTNINARSSSKDIISNKDIVDGHRHKTLSLLWKMIAKWRLSIMVPMESLRFEVNRVKQLHGRTASAILNRAQEQQKEQHLDVPGASNTTAEQELDGESQEMSRTLLAWCQGICAHHGMRVSNFTTSMASGRAICLLIHHYHPKLLERSSILPGAVELSPEVSRDQPDLDWLPFEHNSTSRGEYKRALQNEQANFRLVNECANALGCVPVLLPAFDSENIPEEKIMLLFLTYLCSRLLASRDEILAATKIQRVWLRKVRADRLRKLGQQAEHSARRIQVMVRKALVHRIEKKLKAVQVIQKSARGYAQRKNYLSMRHAVIKLQAHSRSAVLQAHFLQIKDRVMVCQRVIRAFVHRRSLARAAQHLRQVVCTQSVVRRHLIARSIRRNVYYSTKIQAVWRGTSARKQTRRQLARIALIQALVRGFVQQRKFQRMQRATIRIQTQHRMVQARRFRNRAVSAAILVQSMSRMYLASSLYQDLNTSIRIAQTCCRRYLARCQVAKMHRCATSIQSVYRSHRARRALLSQVQAATKIQSVSRRMHAVKRYERVIDACVVLQSQWRSHALERQYKTQVKSATVLQKVVREYRARQQFLHVVSRIVKLQALFRRKIAQRIAKDQWTSIVTIQAAFRRYVTEQSFKKQKRTVVGLQSFFRSKIHRSRYQYYRSMVVLAQARARRNICTQHYSVTKAAIVKLQAFGRRLQAQKNAAYQMVCIVRVQSAARLYLVQARSRAFRQAAIRVQRTFRMYKTRVAFAQKIASVVRVQSFFRALSARAFATTKLCAITKMQACMRMALVQRDQARLHLSATKLQRNLRGFVARQKFLCSIKSIVIVQSLVKRKMGAKRSLRRVRGITTVQSCARRFLTQREVRAKQAAATKIQAVARSRIARAHFLHNMHIIVICQALVRKKLCRSLAQHRLRCVVRLQAVARKFLLQRALDKEQRAVVVIQSFARSQQAQKRLRSALHAAKVIQALLRGNKIRKRFHNQVCAVVRIQTVLRSRIHSYRFGKLRLASVRLQAWMRKMRHQKQHKENLHRIKLLQAFTRGILARQQLVTQHTNATHVQRLFRGRKERKQYLGFRQAVVCLQASHRRRAAQKELQQNDSAAVLIQAVARRWMAQHHFKYTLTAVARIQVVWRRALAVQRLKKQTASSVQIQAVLRGWKARQHVKETLRRYTIVQATCRGWLSRQHLALQQLAAARCQAVLRMCFARRKVARLMTAIIRIQNCSRTFLVKRRAAKSIRAAVLVQATFRGMSVRSNMKHRFQAASKIQAAARAAVIARRYKAFLRSVVSLQAAWRGAVCRADIFILDSAATHIQCIVRGWFARKQSQKTLNSIAVLQSFARGIPARAQYLETCQAIRRIQVFAQRYCLLAMGERRAASKIQAFFRGFLTRRRRSEALIGVGRRLAAATAGATESMTLGGRTRSALDWLLRSKDLAQVLKACNTLKNCIAASPECGESFLNSDATDVLFALIRSCNRSEPHVKVLQVALQVLVQVAQQDRYLKFARLYSAEEQAISCLVDLLQIFRDKAAISSQTLVLLEYYCADDRRAKQHLQPLDGDLYKRLRSIEAVLKRKVAMSRQSIRPMNGRSNDAKQYSERQLLDGLTGLLDQVATL